jgi:nucleotide-binding universal stress UspA family protein
MSRIRRILHPSDFSRASSKAFGRAVERAKANRANLVIAHVLAPAMPLAGDGYISPKIYEDLEASARAWGQKQLNRLLARARNEGVRVIGLLLDGVPHEQIVRAAKSKNANLIVIGTHGRTGLAKFVLGSVAGRVVAMAPCPVMTVRGI